MFNLDKFRVTWVNISSKCSEFPYNPAPGHAAFTSTLLSKTFVNMEKPTMTIASPQCPIKVELDKEITIYVHC